MSTSMSLSTMGFSHYSPDVQLYIVNNQKSLADLLKYAVERGKRDGVIPSLRNTSLGRMLEKELTEWLIHTNKEVVKRFLDTYYYGLKNFLKFSEKKVVFSNLGPVI